MTENIIKYVVFKQKAEYGWISHRELYHYSDVMLDSRPGNPILAYINNVHTSERANRRFTLPFQKIWYKYYLNEEKLDSDESIIFMFEDGSRTCFSSQYIAYLRNKYKNAKFVFASFNSSFRYPTGRVNFLNKNYDLVTSFDRNDCKNLGWFLYTGIYSKLDYEHCDDGYESDLYFAGADKGRLSLLYDIYDKLTPLGIKCDFTVTGVKKSDIRSGTGIKFNHWIKYEDVVKKCCRTRCLLDLIQPGQDGETYRQGEAVAYGIKLITNYKNITKERYFNREQMQVINDASDIDVDFIMKPYKTSDFPYNGCLCPYYRLEAIRDYFNRNYGKEEKNND